MGFSTYTINQIRDHMWRTGTWAKTTTRYISLHDGDPGLTGLNEISEGWYSRVQRDASDANWDDVSDGVAELVAELAFGSPTGMAGSIIVTHVGAWDASTVGNFLMGDELDAPKHLAREVWRNWRAPAYEEFQQRTAYSLQNAFTSSFKLLDAVPLYRATADLGRFFQGVQ